MNRVFLDTLFVVALCNRQDEYHARALSWSKALQNAEFVVTEAVLLEVGNTLARNRKNEAVQMIRSFYESPRVEIVSVSSALFEQAFAFYSQYADKEWGLVDCVSFCAMRERGLVEALTFDQHFVQAGFRALLREDTPKQNLKP